MIELPPSVAYYGSALGAIQVLQHQKLPVFDADQLRDPFLPNQNSPMDFDCQDLFEKSVKTMTSAILGKEAPRGNPNHPLQKAIRRWRGENRFNDESEIRESLVGLLPAMVEKQFNQARKIHDDWLKFVSGKRLLPLFENANNSDLWLLEADRYEGVVIKFNCDEESIFANCLPVTYLKQPAKTVKMADCVAEMVGENNEIEIDFLASLLTQNYQFRSQKEWRLVVDYCADEPYHVSFPRALVQSVYIGASVATHKVKDIVNMTEKLSASIVVYQARCSESSYDFVYQRLSNSSDE